MYYEISIFLMDQNKKKKKNSGKVERKNRIVFETMKIIWIKSNNSWNWKIPYTFLLRLKVTQNSHKLCLIWILIQVFFHLNWVTISQMIGFEEPSSYILDAAITIGPIAQPNYVFGCVTLFTVNSFHVRKPQHAAATHSAPSSMSVNGERRNATRVFLFVCIFFFFFSLLNKKGLVRLKFFRINACVSYQDCRRFEWGSFLGEIVERVTFILVVPRFNAEMKSINISNSKTDFPLNESQPLPTLARRAAIYRSQFQLPLTHEVIVCHFRTFPFNLALSLFIHFIISH